MIYDDLSSVFWHFQFLDIIQPPLIHAQIVFPWVSSPWNNSYYFAHREVAVGQLLAEWKLRRLDY